ncbi:MAG: hypothetical protein HYY03_00740 [Chloroflexi bacterium]|nr:hypothetical protein [Chloroflexota bacterium]
MDTELLSRAKRAEIEREVAHLRLVAAARSVSTDRRAAAPAQRAVPSIPVRLLRALRMAS